MNLTKSIFFTFPNRYCATVPVSTTGSLWTGFGGFRYEACSFLLTKLDSHLNVRPLRKACQFIQPGVDYVAGQISSRHLHSRFRNWVRIDETLSIPVHSFRQMAA